MRRSAGTAPRHQPRAAKRRPGPTPGLPNPHPIGDGVHEPRIGWISPDILDDSEQRLRRYFRDRKTDLVHRGNEPIDKAIRRLGTLAREALEETDAAWWCGLESSIRDPVKRKQSPPWLWADSAKTYLRFWAAPHAGPRPPTKRAAHGLPWLDTSVTPHVLRLWNRRSKSWTVLFGAVSGELAARSGDLFRWAWELSEPADSIEVSWSLVERSLLRRAAEGLLAPRGLGRAGRSGRPAYFACAVLAVLLDVSPERISDSLNYHRRSRSRAGSIAK